jgi:hypothetical protein
MSSLTQIRLSSFLIQLLIILSIPAFSGVLLAQQKPNLHIGTLEFHPYASVKQTYDSNIFLEPKNEENDDYITDIILGIETKMPLIPQREDDFILKTSYQADIFEYYDEKKQDRVDHTVRGTLDFKFTSDFRLRLKDSYKKTADPPDSEKVSLEKRYRNIFDAILSYEREKIKLEGGYRLSRDDYKELNTLDKDDTMFTGIIFYRIFPKTSILAEYNYGLIEYDTDQTNSDSNYYQIRAGVTGDLLPKLTGTVKAGYRRVDYDQSGKNDFSGFTLFGDTRYTVTERTLINLSVERTSEESSYSTNSHFTSTEIGIKVNHQFLERLGLNSGAFYRWNRYPDETTEDSKTEKRKDKIGGVNIGAKYEIKEWLFVTADYEYKRRTSNFPIFEYRDHKTSVSILAMF